LPAIIKEDNPARVILKKNEVDIQRIEKELISILESKAKMNNKQKIYTKEKVSLTFF